MKNKELTIEEAFKKLNENERREVMENVLNELLKEGGVTTEDFRDLPSFTSEKEEMEKILADMISQEYLDEDLNDPASLEKHFNKHCKRNPEMNPNEIIYNFPTSEDYKNYVDEIAEKCNYTKPNFEFTDITDKDQLNKALNTLTLGAIENKRKIVRIPPKLGLTNRDPDNPKHVQYFFLSNSKGVSSEPTIDLVAKAVNTEEFLTVYPIKLSYFKTKVVNLGK